MAPQSLLLLACALGALYQPAVSQTPPVARQTPPAILENAYDLINMATCGTSKSCFVFPTGCKQTQDCDAIVTWAQDLSQNNIHFEIGGKRRGNTDKWFAVGMSDDQVMGDDTVLSCTSNNVANVLVRYSWNYPDKTNVVDPDSNIQSQIIVTNSRYYNAFQACVFDVPITPTTTNARVKVIKDSSGFKPYFIFLAWGNAAGYTKIQHSTETRMMTSQAYKLNYREFTNDSGRLTFGIFSLLCLAAHLL